MTEEFSISTFATESEPRKNHDGPAPPVPSCTVGWPADVNQLALPFEGRREFEDEEFRKGYSSNHLLSFLPLQLRALRKSEGLSQKELADRLETRQSAVSRLEQVDNGSLNIGTAIQIGEALDRPFIAYWGHHSEVLGQLVKSAENPQAYLLTAPFRHDPGFWPWKPPLPCSENALIRAIQKRLFDWLDTPDKPKAEKLMRFLQGYDLPPISQELPPFQWIVRAVRDWGLTGVARKNFFGAVAECLAELAVQFDRKKDADWAFWRPLFYICELMPDPESLGEMLYRLDTSFREAARMRLGPIPADVKYAFDAALAKNDRGSRRAAVLRVINAPPPFLKNVTMQIYTHQREYSRKEDFQLATRKTLRETLVEYSPADQLPINAAAMLFRGVFESCWVDRTVRWTMAALKEELSSDYESYLQPFRNPQPEEQGANPAGPETNFSSFLNVNPDLPQAA